MSSSLTSSAARCWSTWSSWRRSKASRWPTTRRCAAELSSYGAGLDRLPELVLLSKRDLLPPERGRGGARGVARAARATRASACSPSPRRPARAWTSCASAILSALPELPRWPARDGTREQAAEFEVEHRVYRPAGEGGYSVEREDDGAFRVTGRGVELLFERHDIANEEALAYLEQRLNEIGVVAALRAAGFEPGDEVRVGEHEFELYP